MLFCREQKLCLNLWSRVRVWNTRWTVLGLSGFTRMSRETGRKIRDRCQDTVLFWDLQKFLTGFVCLLFACLFVIYTYSSSSLWLYDLMPQVATFDTVEDFWALMNYISEANNLPVGSDYSLFKVGQNNTTRIFSHKTKNVQILILLLFCRKEFFRIGRMWEMHRAADGWSVFTIKNSQSILEIF